MRAAVAGALAGVALLVFAGPAGGAVVPTPPDLACPPELGEFDLFEQRTEEFDESGASSCSYYAKSGLQQPATVSVNWSTGDIWLSDRKCGEPIEDSEYISYVVSKTRRAYAGYSPRVGDDPAPWAALARRLLPAAEARAAPCPGPEQPETAPVPAETQPPSAAPTCVLEGRVSDNQGRPVAKVHIRVVHGANGGSVVDTATNRSGLYRVEGVAEQVTVRLVLEEGGPLGRFRVYFRGQPAELETAPLRVQPGIPCRLDITLNGASAGYALVNPGSADAALWRDLGSIYQRLFKAAEFARSLGIELDYSLPLDVYSWCTDPALLCDPARPPAFYVGSRTDGQVVAEPYIALQPSASALRQGRYDDTLYHEFGHHVMTDAFGDLLPAEGGDENHGGYYVNRASTDSWVEGFANFFAAMVAKHADRRLFGEHFEANGFVKDLEWDWSAWNDAGRGEEWAVAGLLLDLEDGTGDYRAGRARPDLYGKLRFGKAVRQGRPLVFGTLTDVRAEVSVVVEVFDPEGDLMLADRAFLVDDLFVFPVPSGVPVGTVRVKVVEGRGGQAADDDPIDSSPKAIWKAFAGYAASKAAKSSAGYPYVADVFQLFRALDRAFGSADRDGNGTKDLVEVFRAHGFFGDVNGNLTFDPGERTGLTSHPAYVEGGQTYPDRDPRYTAEALPEQLATVATGGVEAQSIVFVGYPGDTGRGYSYLAAPDGEGRIVLAVPPSESGAVVTVMTVASGYLPALNEVDAASFWAQAAEHPGEPFLRLEAKLEPGELRVTAGGSRTAAPVVLLMAGGALIALAGSAVLLRRRRVRA